MATPAGIISISGPFLLLFVSLVITLSQKPDQCQIGDTKHMSRIKMCEELGYCTKNSTTFKVPPERPNGSAREFCPNNFIYDKKAALCYKLITKVQLPFNLAYAMCSTFHDNSRLVILNSEDKMDSVNDHKENDVFSYWIGGTRGVNGKFDYWMDRSYIDPNMWGTGEPNNYENNENCLQAAQGLKVTTYTLNDDDCKGKANFICEIPFPGY